MSSKAVFVAFDLETTGLVAGVDRIAELAAVEFHGEQILDTFEQLVDPGIPMPEAAGRVNGITDAMLRGQPRAADVLPGFLSFLARGTPVAHNAGFDVGFVKAEAEAAGLALPDGPVLDTRDLAWKIFPGRFSYSLDNLVRDLSLEDRAEHRALADAHACRKLFLRCTREVRGDADALAARAGRLLDFRARAPRTERAAVIQAALESGAEVSISYRSARGEVTRRTIRPLAFTLVGRRVAVSAFCTLRGENRTFLLDSIEDAGSGS